MEQIDSKAPFISYLVPVYNVPEDYLRHCLDSLSLQEDCEIIVVDDGSSDGSGQICDEYQKKFSNVKVIHQPNKGLSGARNTAFLNSVGKYISFVDGDDAIAPETTAKLKEVISQKKYDVVLFDVTTCKRNTKEVKHSFPQYQTKEFDEDECHELQQRVLYFNGKIAQVFAKAIRRDLLFENNILHDEDCKQGAEGLVFNFKLFHYVKSAYYTDDPLYLYQINVNSISHRLSDKNIDLTLLCFHRIKEYICDYAMEKETMRLFYNRMTYVIVTAAVSGYFNPHNHYSGLERKNKLTKFLKDDIVTETIMSKSNRSLPLKRKVVYWLVIHRRAFALSIIGKIRAKQYAGD